MFHKVNLCIILSTEINKSKMGDCWLSGIEVGEAGGGALPAAPVPSSPAVGAAQQMMAVRSFGQAVGQAAAARAVRLVVLCLYSPAAKSFQQGAN